MTRMIDPRWDRELSRRAVVVTLVSAPLALVTAWHTALAQSTPTASPTASGDSATAGTMAAANAFLGTLSELQQQSGLFAW